MASRIDSVADGGASLHAIVAARDEEQRIAATLKALRAAFPAATLWVADDGSRDATASIAREHGAEPISAPRPLGKGGAMTLAARAALAAIGGDSAVVLLCDGDLADSARRLAPLVAEVRDGRADLAVAAFARSVGGGFGLALGFAAWAIRRRCRFHARAPISGQRAIHADMLRGALPFAAGYGMEIGMTVDVVRAGGRVVEIEIDLSHRASGRTLAGFAHRGAQLVDFVRVYLARG